MPMFHECRLCETEGFVDYDVLCGACAAERDEQARAETQCPECGRLGVTATGICYPCENTSAVDAGRAQGGREGPTV